MIWIWALITIISDVFRDHERAVRQQAEARQAAEGYIREVAGTSPVDELAKLDDLRRQGAISQEQFDRLKAKIVA